jgi:hypothetical protein
MLATFAFDVCHDVYLAAREAIDSKIPTLNAEASGKYLWRPDRMPRLAEYVCDFALAGERALLGGDARAERNRGGQRGRPVLLRAKAGNCGAGFSRGWQPRDGFSRESLTCVSRASRMTMFRLYYLGGAEYQAARRQMGISEITWADWAEEIRRRVGSELTRAGMFPPAKYFREMGEKAS